MASLVLACLLQLIICITFTHAAYNGHEMPSIKATLYAAPLATWDYPVGARAPSLLVIARDLDDDLVVCEWSLEANMCRTTRPYTLLLNETSSSTFDPVAFSFSTFTPFPGRDVDARPLRVGDGEFLRSMSTWAGLNSDVKFLPSGIAGFAGGSNLTSAKYTAACAVRTGAWRSNPDCQSWVPLNYVSIAFSGCETCCDAKGQSYTESSDWPANATETWPGCSASPYRFVELGRNFSMDERWYNAYFEAAHYAAVSQYQLGSAGERYEWLGTLGTLMMLRWDPVINVAGFVALRFNRTYIYQSDLSTYSSLRRVSSLVKNMAHRMDMSSSNIKCLPAVDEITYNCPGCGWGGNFVKSGIISFVQITQLFSFWQRGVAYFSSVAVGNVNVQLRILLCRLGGTVQLPIMEHVSTLAPRDEIQIIDKTTGLLSSYYYSTNGRGIYLENREPANSRGGRDAEWLLNAESIPVGGTAHAMVADGRLEAGGPLVYHAILRVPFFPPYCKLSVCQRTSNCQPFCVITKQDDLNYPCQRFIGNSGFFDDTIRGVCPEATVKHVIALWSWNVVGTSASIRRAPVPIAERWVPHTDSCIVQNGYVGEAGAGVGALEGKFVEGYGRPYSYYVLGDEIVRLRRPGTFESGIGGEVSGRLRLQPQGWAPSLSEWYSVRAAVYSRGSLFVVRQKHTALNTDCQRYLDRDIVTTGFSNRMRSVLRPSSGPVELLKVENVEGDAMGPVRVAIKDFYQDIGGGLVTDNLGMLDSFDYRAPFPETPYITFFNKQPARVIKIYTSCPAGQTFNVGSIFVDTTGSNCVPLSPGLYANKTGVISEDEADVCPVGTFSAGGATSCTVCPAGTYSGRGAGSCYDCPQNTFSLAAGDPCTPCAANAFTQTKKWTTECLVCEAGTYLPYTGATICLACPAQTWSQKGALESCNFCGEGEVPSADASRSEKCPAGTYQRENRTACIPCPELTFTSSAGTFGQCTPCSPGWVSIDTKIECRPCLPGYFSYGSDCLRCHGNSIAPQPGQPNCTQCPSGQVATEDKQNCIACPAGTVFTVINEVATCEKCPINTITSSAGLDECTPCNLGEVAAADSQTCVPCGAGTYRAEGMTACAPAPERSVALERSEMYTVCNPGEVPSRSKTECLLCPAGSYQNNETCERCPLNTIASSPGQATCTPCLEGEVAAADSQTCVPCQAGSYRTADMASCAVVPERASALERSPVYTNCSAGYIPNLARSECVACRAGYYQSRDSCERCPTLTISSLEGSDRCTPCPAGYQTVDDQQSCIPCGVGTYRSTAMFVCTAVPFRSVALAGSSNYTTCSPGAIPDSAKAQCIQCAAGFYQTGEACERCSINTVSSLPGAINCTACLPGYVSASDSQTCIPCAAGSYRSAGMPTCLPVPPRAAALPGAALYTNCSAGAIPNAAQSECFNCAAGSYQEGDGCKRCPDLTHAPSEGSTSCALCSPGTVPADDLQSCVPCGAGTYRGPDMLLCTAVPFRSVALPRSSNFTLCDPGSIPDGAKAQCIQCPAGSYQIRETCERCALNSVTGSPGQTTCTVCSPGYVSASDSQTCIACPVGTYRSGDLQSCTAVPERSVAQQGSPSYTACGPGTVPNAALSECLACPAGSYQVGDVCRRCPDLSVASSPAGTSCRVCDAGQVPADDFESCVDCPAGKYRGIDMSVCTTVPWRSVALPGSANYTTCRPGAIPDMARAQCVDCPAGAFQTGESCERCPVNSVTSSPGLTRCSLCLEGYVSSSDSQLCLPCGSGTHRATENLTCLPIPPRNSAPPGSSWYVECAPGWIPDNALSFCEPCIAGTYQANDTCELCPVNTITSAAGLDSCSECPPGTVSAADSQSCIPCPSGTFRNGSMLSCEVVPTGSVALQASFVFTVCPRGTVPNAPGDECVPCGKGNIEVDRVCRPCAGNTHNPSATATECIECAPGTVASADRQTCQTCLPGKYRSAGMVECATCPWGTYSIGGAPECTPCAPGTVSSEDRTSCEACEPGSYERNKTCAECPVNFVTPHPGATSCLACNPGFVSSLDRQNCLPCLHGTYRSEGNSTCETCPFRFYTPASGQPVCTPCPNGTESTDDRTECRPCSRGFYEKGGFCWQCPDGSIAPVPQLTSCERCPNGTVSNEDRTICRPCRGGMFHARDQNVCLPCRIGLYAPPKTYGGCLVCPLGYYASADSTYCIPCDPGQLMRNGSAVCEQCPTNTFTDTPGQTSCKPCLPGFVSAPDTRSCIPCRPGLFRSENMSSCAACPAATISSSFGSSGCAFCGAGRIPRDDRAECVDCLPGFVSQGRTTCRMCGPVEVAPSAGLSECQPCPAGHIADSSRLTCLPCDAGTYIPSGSTQCVKCPANTISEAGAGSCTACPAGEISENGIACSQCVPGTYRNETMLSCEACPFGTYSKSAASGSCLECPADKICPIATVDPVDVGMRTSIDVETPDETASGTGTGTTTGTGRRLLQVAPRAIGRRLLQVAIPFAGDSLSPKLQKDDVKLGRNTATVSQPSVLTEEPLLAALNKLFLIILAGLLGLAVLLAMALTVYLKLIPASTPEARAARYRRMQRLHFLYRHVVQPTRGAAAVKAQEKKGEGEEASKEASALTDIENRTVSGAFFTIVGILAILVAIGFVVVQWNVANYTVVQSLNPGTSPSADAIRGTFTFAATFRGYTGPCTASDASFVSSGMEGVQNMTVVKYMARTCTLAWTCSDCRVASIESAYARLRLNTRAAFAISINYTATLPEQVSAKGMLQPSTNSSVFRGATPVDLPLDLTAMHFTSPLDGRPRYYISIASTDAEAGERGGGNFGLCPPGRPLASCPDEFVQIGVLYRTASVYTLVERKTKATILDTVSNVAALASAALGLGAQVLALYLFAQRLLEKRGIMIADTAGDVLKRLEAKKAAQSGTAKADPDSGSSSASRAPSKRRPEAHHEIEVCSLDVDDTVHPFAPHSPPDGTGAGAGARTGSPVMFTGPVFERISSTSTARRGSLGGSPRSLRQVATHRSAQSRSRSGSVPDLTDFAHPAEGDSGDHADAPSRARASSDVEPPRSGGDSPRRPAFTASDLSPPIRGRPGSEPLPRVDSWTVPVDDLDEIRPAEVSAETRRRQT